MSAVASQKAPVNCGCWHVSGRFCVLCAAAAGVRQRHARWVATLELYTVWGVSARTRSFEVMRGGKRYKLVSFRGGPLEVYGFYDDGLEMFVGYARDLLGTAGER